MKNTKTCSIINDAPKKGEVNNNLEDGYTRSQYESKIAGQENGYKATIMMIGRVIQALQKAGRISENVKVTGRIKSYRSAMRKCKKRKKIR